jgi:hypothetical protein
MIALACTFASMLRAPLPMGPSGSVQQLPYVAVDLQVGDAQRQLVLVDRGVFMRVPATGGGAVVAACGNACAYLATAHAAGLVGQMEPHDLQQAVVGILRTDQRFRELGTRDNLDEWGDAVHQRFHTFDEYVNYIAPGGRTAGFAELLALTVHLRRPIHVYVDTDRTRQPIVIDHMLPDAQRLAAPLRLAHVHGGHFVALMPAVGGVVVVPALPLPSAPAPVAAVARRQPARKAAAASTMTTAAMLADDNSASSGGGASSGDDISENGDSDDSSVGPPSLKRPRRSTGGARASGARARARVVAQARARGRRARVVFRCCCFFFFFFRRSRRRWHPARLCAPQRLDRAGRTV